MAKNILNTYLERQAEFKSQIQTNSLPPESLIAVQELSYRIYILETCKMLTKTVPVTKGLRVLEYHYRLSEAIICEMLKEHQIAAKTNEDGKQKREAAYSSLKRVIQDWRKRFNSNNVSMQEHYAKDFGMFINAVLSVWIPYRNTFVNL